MDPDKYQQAWQARSSQTRVTVDADALLKEVQRNQLQFRATIFWRDFREVGIALVMLPLWFYLGVAWSLPWTWYLTGPALVWVIGFFAVDRMRHKKRIGLGATLLESVKESLNQVEHQIWLLRNVFWWYLLPFTISIQAFIAHVFCRATELAAKDCLNVAVAAGAFVFVVLVLSAVYCFLDYINQRAVRLCLEPRRQELLALLASLGGDESAAEHATVSGAKSVESPRIFRRWLVVAVLSLVTYVVIVLILASGSRGRGH